MPLDALTRHQARRAAGVPTLSSLAGPTGLALRSWREWAATDGRPAAWGGPDITDAVGAWLRAAFADTRPSDAARRWLAALLPPDRRISLERATPFDIHQLWDEWQPAGPPSALARAILVAAARGEACGPVEIPRILSREVESAGLFSAIVAAAGLLPPAKWPALLALSPGASLLRGLATLAAEVPGLPLGAAVDGGAPEAGSRVAAMLAEGAVDVPSVPGADLARRLAEAGVAPPPASASLLASRGLSPAGADALVEFARAARQGDDYNSKDEQLFRELLESSPETAGLFAVNARLPFDHGPRAGEGDFVAESLKLVVELDGEYYHLRPDQYRRDRRKDWLYQRHGYCVLRVLAGDLLDRAEEALAAVREAVAWRRSTRPGGDVP